MRRMWSENVNGWSISTPRQVTTLSTLMCELLKMNAVVSTLASWYREPKQVNWVFSLFSFKTFFSSSMVFCLGWNVLKCLVAFKHSSPDMIFKRIQIWWVWWFFSDEITAVGGNPRLNQPRRMCRCSVLLENDTWWQKLLVIFNQSGKQDFTVKLKIVVVLTLER